LTKTLSEKLHSRKVRMDVLDESGRLPLHYAAARSHRDLVEFFVVANKVNPNIVDKEGKSPLVYATQADVDTHKELPVANLLLGVKADPNILYPNPEYATAKTVRIPHLVSH
jgi:hypothetical protein